jgi:hypothetical protein
MTRQWHNPDRPTPAELAAWADGELEGSDAARVEAWLSAHPDDAPDAESSRLVGLFRDHAAPEPSAAAWDRTLSRIAERTNARRNNRWQLTLFCGIAAAALAGVIAASFLLPGKKVTNLVVDATTTIVLPPGDDNDEPFPVARAGEIDVLAMDARDANRVVIIGNPLLEPFEVVSSEEVELVSVGIDFDEGMMPKLQRGEHHPMVIAAHVNDDP